MTSFMKMKMKMKIPKKGNVPLSFLLRVRVKLI